MPLKKYAGLVVSVEGHFENSSKSYEYLTSNNVLSAFINCLLFYDFEKDVFCSYIDTPYGKNKRFYLTDVHLIGANTFKVQDTKATKFINNIFFIEEDGQETDISKSVFKEMALLDKDVENLFGEDFPQFFNKDKEKEGVIKFENNGSYKINTGKGEYDHMIKRDSAEKRGFNIPGLKNVGKQLTGVFAFSIITQKLAVKMDGGYFSFDIETKALTDETGFAMEIPFPAMILPERFSKLKAGDLVISPDSGKLVYVVDVDAEAKTYNYVGANGIVQSVAKVQNAVMKDMDFVEKVVNPLADAFDFSENDGLFDNPMMMMALMGNGGNIFGGGNGGNNDMMSMLMLSKMMKK